MERNKEIERDTRDDGRKQNEETQKNYPKRVKEGRKKEKRRQASFEIRPTGFAGPHKQKETHNSRTSQSLASSFLHS